MTSQYVKPPLQPLQYARNGKYPDAAYQAEMADLANHLALYQMKEIARFGMTTTVIAAPSPEDVLRPRWRTRYRASPNVVAVACYGTLALSESEHSVEHYAIVDFTTGATTKSAELSYGGALSDASNPDDLGLEFTFVKDGSQPWQPTADTLYDVTVSDFNSRIVALTIYEVSLNSAPPFSEGYAVKTPILDTDRQELVEAARLMWKQQAAPLFTWTADDQASPRTYSASTPKNVIDNSSTTVSAATVGFTIDLRNRSTVSRGTVPCVFSVYGRSQQSAGGDGSVLLLDSTGATLATAVLAESSSANAWDSVVVDLPATLAKYDVHYASDVSGDTVSLYAVTLGQHTDGV